MSKDGGHAFPQSLTINDNGNIVWGPQGGMSLRDWFAGQALPVVMTGAAECDWPDIGAEEKRNVIAALAYAFADAMLEERSKS